MSKYEVLRPFAETDSQRYMLDALARNSNIRETANELNISERNLYERIRTLKKRAARRGSSPDHDMTKTTPEGYTVKGTSTLYDENGEVKVQWVKTQMEKEQAEEVMRSAFEAFKSDIPKYKPGRYTPPAIQVAVIVRNFCHLPLLPA